MEHRHFSNMQLLKKAEAIDRTIGLQPVPAFYCLS